MKLFVAIIAIALVVIGYSALSFVRKVRVSSALSAQAVPYSKIGNGSFKLLVLGDSTAVGVGASKPSETLAARIATELNASDVSNYAVSGARVADLRSQIEKALDSSYQYILIGIGANDVVRFEDAEQAASELEQALKRLPPHDRLLVYMAGNLGGSQLFPSVMNPQYTKRTLEYHKAFEPVVRAVGGVYVNLYTDPANDPFQKDPAHYFAADGFHPSSAGYLVWFEMMRPVLQ